MELLIMYVEQKGYSKEVVKELQVEQREANHPIVNGGYPTFNTCAHTTLDLSHLEDGTENWMQTLSIKLPNGTYATVCVMEMGNQVCMDLKYHGEGKTRIAEFKNGTSRDMPDCGLVALILDKDK